MKHGKRKVLFLCAALTAAMTMLTSSSFAQDGPPSATTLGGTNATAPPTPAPATQPGSKSVVAGNNVMVIPPGRYEAIDAAHRFVIQLCRGTEECARRREDLKVFARSYSNQTIGFGQINLDTHTEYDAQRKVERAKSQEAAEAAAKAGSRATVGQPHVNGDTTITAIPSTLEPRGYFDTCPGKSPDAVTYVLKADSDYLTEGLICTPQELERFIKQNTDVSALGSVSYGTPDAYARAAVAERLEALTKPSMVTVWTTHAGKRSGVGPGFAVGIDKAGNCEISTANHVTDEELAAFEVTMANGQSYPARKMLDKREREVAILTVAVPADACKPLKFAATPVAVGQQVFMGTMPLPEHFDPRVARFTRGPSDTIGEVTAVQPFAALPGLDSRYQLGQEVVFEGIQGYKGDSGNPCVNGDGELVSMAFVTQAGGGVTLAVPARFIREALDELHGM